MQYRSEKLKSVHIALQKQIHCLPNMQIDNFKGFLWKIWMMGKRKGRKKCEISVVIFLPDREKKEFFVLFFTFIQGAKNINSKNLFLTEKKYRQN